MDFVIEMRGITKEFPGIVANDDVTLQLREGEIHALLGENGAGKSTLMSVLFGMYRPESGCILKNGAAVSIRSPNDATRLGIGMVHQHFKLVHNFTVLENIVLGAESTRRGFLRMVEARRQVVALSRRYGLEIDPDVVVSDISVGMQQRVEILKMLYRQNEVLIFDEPTAVLTPQEIDELMKTMRELAAEGKSILFITHKLDEIMKVADRCTVLRKGKSVGTVETGRTDKRELSRMMVGREIDLRVDKSEARPGPVLLEVVDLVVRSAHAPRQAVRGVSFAVRAGEIVCIAGIDGNGQSELVYALTGLMPAQGGCVRMEGDDVTSLSVRARSVRGMAHIPEDRHRHGLVMDYDLAANLALQRYFTPQFQQRGFLRFAEISSHAEWLIGRYDIRSGQGASTPVRAMSGGNQQKAIVAREIDRNPKLLVAVQPTRGLDVGAIETIHRQLVEERDKGTGILLVSLELDEVMTVSDRILVLYEGKIVAELDPRSTSYEQLGLCMAGAQKEVSA